MLRLYGDFVFRSRSAVSIRRQETLYLIGSRRIFVRLVGWCYFFFRATLSLSFGVMAGEGDKSNDFYAVLGLNKECTDSELRNAYKKLAMKWHPDRCSASGNSMFVEEAKKKFQAIQQAYSVLSNSNKRLMYDVGVYDSDDEENGMGDFLSEMVTMMSQTKSNENGEESFEELQQLFEDMFQEDIGSDGSNSLAAAGCSTPSTCVEYRESSNLNKRNSTEMNCLKADDSFDFGASFQNFCFGTSEAPPRYQEGKARHSRRRKSQ